MKTKIGAGEAKTRLPELLRAVGEGQRFTIMNRGRAIADLIPSEDAAPKDSRVAIEKFQAFLSANPVKRATNTKALIEKGRDQGAR